MATKPTNTEAHAKDAQTALVTHIEHALAGMRFGSVEIVIHAGKVMQIERRDKYSYPPSLSVESIHR